MKLKQFSPGGLLNLAQLCWFYALNRWRYKKLALGAIVFRPLRIDGAGNISLSKNARVQKYSWLFAKSFDQHPAELIIGEGCAIGDFNHICAVRKVVFGKNVLTANRVYVSDNLHSFEDINTPIMHQPVRFKAEVRIGDGSWLGENVCVIGARIGRNCVIGANAVVTSDIPDYSVAVGAPARVIKRYDHDKKTWVKVN